MKQYIGHADVQLSTSMTALCDESLVASAKNGTHLAYGELCRRHSGVAFRTIYRITRNTQDAEDALQNSLMSAFIHLN